MHRPALLFTFFSLIAPSLLPFSSLSAQEEEKAMKCSATYGSMIHSTYLHENRENGGHNDLVQTTFTPLAYKNNRSTGIFAAKLGIKHLEGAMEQERLRQSALGAMLGAKINDSGLIGFLAANIHLQGHRDTSSFVGALQQINRGSDHAFGYGIGLQYSSSLAPGQVGSKGALIPLLILGYSKNLSPHWKFLIGSLGDEGGIGFKYRANDERVKAQVGILKDGFLRFDYTFEAQPLTVGLAFFNDGDWIDYSLSNSDDIRLFINNLTADISYQPTKTSFVSLTGGAHFGAYEIYQDEELSIKVTKFRRVNNKIHPFVGLEIGVEW